MSTVDISVIIPAFNEEFRLGRTLESILAYFRQHSRWHEIIVVDDGSADGTAALAKTFAASDAGVKVMRLPKNAGKGNAVRQGMRRANGYRLLFTDADGSTAIDELSGLERALDEGADVAIGSRALFSEATIVTTDWHRWAMGRIFNAAVNCILLSSVSDTQCGFKLFTREAAKFLFREQQSNGFSFDVEILYLARKAGFKIAEVPVNWNNEPGSKVHLLCDSARMFFDLFRFRLLHRNVKRIAQFESGSAAHDASNVFG